MMRFRSSSNGVQGLFIIRQLALYSTSISTEVNPNFVNYLIQNLGFSNKQAISTSSKLTRFRKHVVTDFDFVENANSVVAFLKEIGLKQSQIQYGVSFEPRILLSNVDKTLNPKTEALQKLGISKTDIAEIVSCSPALLFSSLNTTIVPTIETLREIMECEKNVILLLKKLRFTNLSAIPKYLVPNIALLRAYGFSIDSIWKFLLWTPSSFFKTTDVLKDAVTIVEEKLGIPRNSPQFFNGVRIVNSLNGKTIESKIQSFKSFGWTDSHIAIIVSSNPCILGISQDRIKKKLDFLMNELGYDPTYLASKPCFLAHSLEKRVVPRHKVFLVLKENGFITKDSSFLTALAYTESKFLKTYVLPFKEVHQFYSKLAGISLEMLTL